MRRLLGLLALSVVMAIAPVAMAQSVEGKLFITVTDEQGNPVEGAKVVAQGADFARTITSDAAGRARFIDMYPGRYDVTVTTDGYNTMILREIQVDIGASPEMSVKLQASQIVEEVVVMARTPVMDQRNLGTSTIYSRGELEQVPQARDPWSVISSIPGVTVDRVNVAGSEAGQQAQLVGKGDDGDQTVWLMDGVEFTDVGAIGGSATYLDFNSFEQIGFSTAGANFELQTPGVQMEFVTKQGSNSVTGTARLLYAEKDMQTENNAGLSQPSWYGGTQPIAGNSINEVFEKNFDVGGPLVKDNLWFWMGFSQNDINVSLITGDPDVTKLRNVSAKLHGQFLGKGSYKAFFTDGNKLKSGRGGGIDRPPETTWDQSGPSPIYGASVGYFFTPNLEASIQFSKVAGGFGLRPQGDFGNQIFYDENGVYHGTYLLYETDRPQDQLLAKGNWFFSTGAWDHELKFGYRYKSATVDSISKYSDWDMVSNKFYAPNYIYIYRELNTSVDMTYNNVWIGDTVLKGPWTLSLGFNYSQQTGEQGASTAAAAGIAPSLVGAAEFPGFNPGFDWNAITPRAGMTYTFDWERRLMLRASYGQYVDQLDASVVSFNLPLGYTGVQYLWDDANDNDFVDWDDANNTGELVDTSGNGTVGCEDAQSFSGIDPCNTTAFASPNLISPDLDPPRLDEFIVGAEYEVARDFTLGLNYTFRQKDDFVWKPYYDPNGNLTPSGATPFAGTDAYEIGGTTGGTAPDGSSTYAGEYWVLTPQADADLDTTGRGRLQTNNPGYKQEFNGIELVATKRLSHKWRMRAFIMYSEWQQKFDGELPLNPGLYGRLAQNSGDPTNFRGGTTDDGGLIAVQSQSSGNKRDVFVGSSTWQFNVNGLYQMPKNWSVSGNIYGRQGYGLGNYSTSPNTSESFKAIQNQEIDSVRYDDLFMVDLRVAKTWLFGQNTNVELAGEVFNATNQNTVLQQDQRMDDTVTTFQRIGEIVSPRVLRIVATVNF